MSVTHAQLVSLAASYLRRTCSVVVTELVTVGETPDVIGWRGCHSTVIECKTSRSDFAADAQKRFRVCPAQGVGVSRYFLAPSGLIAVHELPARWGLLEVTARGIRLTRKAEAFPPLETHARHEVQILLSALRRVGTDTPCTSIRRYTHETLNTATLSTEM